MNENIFSQHLDLDDAFRRAGRKIPLTWARSDSENASNFGDAASAFVVSCISGRAIAIRNFNDPLTRLAAIGTIGHDMRFGTVHLWGTGIDSSIRAFGKRDAGFAASPNTTYVVHATRGPNTRKSLLDAGIYAPPIYGDGAWFLPKIINGNVKKTCELGVIPHISEMTDITVGCTPKYIRHSGGEADGVRFISTRHAPDLISFKSKLQEILCCKRIISTSFHGMMIADAYKIPCLYFPFNSKGPAMLNVDSGPKVVDHRFADFYMGAGRKQIPAYGQSQLEPTAWDRVIDAVDQLWTPMEHPRAEIFFEAFPFRPCVSFSDLSWPLNDALFDGLKW